MNKLLQIQRELKAPKGNYNSFGKYRYRSCEDILEAVKPLLAKYDCLLFLSDRPVVQNDWHFIQATATFIDGDQTIEVTAYARESEEKKGMDASQITGTASSYARKYALNGLFLIDDTKDADTDEYVKTTKEEDPKTLPPKQETIEKFKSLCTEEQYQKMIDRYGDPTQWTEYLTQKWIKQVESRG